jgi:2-hydroxy-3-keto-5-methylthiopentenyl-1-phosphate phosphatase
MTSPMERTVLFLDFDNTVTIGDVLDAVIERFSVTERWRSWESAWKRGDLSTSECLSLQIGDLRVGADELIRFVSDTAIDARFPEIVDWCRDKRIPLLIVSDNFSVIVRAILKRHSLGGVAFFANELLFDGDRPTARFPHASARCSRCAHCKAVHFTAFPSHRKIYVGDGLSDICPAEGADLVFAKDALAEHLARTGTPFLPFASLGDVLHCLEGDSRYRGVEVSTPGGLARQ